MPNWVYNNLTVIGSPDEVAAVRDQLNASYTRAHSQTTWDEETQEWTERKTVATVHEPALSFWNIVRPSDDIMDEYASLRSAENTRSGWLPPEVTGEGSLLEENPTHRVSNHWYDWNIRNWGTKWDAADVEFDSYGDDHLHYRFSTAWSPPVEVITALSAQFVGVAFTLEWEEEQGFGGEFLFRGGDYEVLQEWDIPSSHADNVARERDCVCDWEPDDQDYWWDDCPREEVAA